MTYCVGILLNEGVVLASDTRTNAGIDRVSTFRKMHVLEKPGERFFALLTAGNLSLTQGGGQSAQRMAQSTRTRSRDLFAVASHVRRRPARGRRRRRARCTRSTAAICRQHERRLHVSFILGGQIKGGQLRLFLLYSAGNFIEATADTHLSSRSASRNTASRSSTASSSTTPA